MLDVFSSVKSILKTDSTIIDNIVCRLHYKASVFICIVFGLLVTSRQYVGDPIDCIQSDGSQNIMINNYCWVHSTFTLPEVYDKTIGVEVPHLGIDKYTPEEDKVYHKYYQWVCFVLFLQAMFFYLPRYLWKIWENGCVKSLLLVVNDSKMAHEEKKTLTSDYLFANFYHQKMYFIKFFCEILNFVNVVDQIYFVDIFLGGEFTTYGFDVIKFIEINQKERIDPMVKVFPKMTKCTFYEYGFTGNIKERDFLCILPLNVINEKIYVFLWFWMLILAILFGLVVIYRLVLILWPRSRTILLRSQCHLGNRICVDIVANKSGLGDWFFLYLIGENIQPFKYKEIVENFACRIIANEAHILPNL